MLSGGWLDCGFLDFALWLSVVLYLFDCLVICYKFLVGFELVSLFNVIYLWCYFGFDCSFMVGWYAYWFRFKGVCLIVCGVGLRVDIMLFVVYCVCCIICLCLFGD